MFASILGRAKAAVGGAVEKQISRAATLVPFVMGVAYALAGLTAVLTEQFGRSNAYWIMAAGLGALGAIAAIVVSVRERSQERHEEMSVRVGHDVRSVSEARQARSDPPAARAVPLSIFGVFRAAVSDWLEHRATRLGAALSYYSVFSLGPLLLIVISVAGLVFGQDAVRGALSAQLQGLLGDTGSQAVEAMLKGAAVETTGYWAATSGIVLLLLAALGVVVQLKDALNTVWEVKKAEHASIWTYIHTYVISLAGILSLGFLLAVSLVVSTGLTALSGWLGGGQSILWQGTNLVVSLIVLALLFAALFRWFPDADVEWGDVWLGAFVTSVLFNVGKLGIAWYIGSQGLESTYGAAASIVVLLMWVFYSSQIVLFGAEVSHVYARRRRPL
jgi:membrane protein